MPVNETLAVLPLERLLTDGDGWGREQGREVFGKLVALVEAHAGSMAFALSLHHVRHLDTSFASEAIVALVQRYRGRTGFRLVSISDDDIVVNIVAAVARVGQPVLAETSAGLRFLGPAPSAGLSAVVDLVLERGRIRAADVAAGLEISIANASNKLKQLWEQGYLLRCEESAASGGTEFVYSLPA